MTSSQRPIFSATEKELKDCEDAYNKTANKKGYLSIMNGR